jgi:hypothetical protein
VSNVDASPGGPPVVTVAIECQGPVGEECGRTLHADVPQFGTSNDWRGVRCSTCGRVNHASNVDVIGPGGEGE